MKTTLGSLALALVAAFAAQGAFATTAVAPGASGAAAGGAGAAVMSACQADIQKYCPNIQPGGGELKSCMKQNRKNLSSECKGALKQARAAKKAGGDSED